MQREIGRGWFFVADVLSGGDLRGIAEVAAGHFLVPVGVYSVRCGFNIPPNSNRFPARRGIGTAFEMAE